MNCCNPYFSYIAAQDRTNQFDIWYNKLAVKPSTEVTTDLRALIVGLLEDQILQKCDLFHVIGGLETDEQRLKPIISTSGLDFTNVNSVTLDSGGAKSNGSSYINLNWIPDNNQNMYRLNSGTIAVYVRENTNSGFDAGVVANSRALDIRSRSTGVFYGRINNSASTLNIANADSRGMYACQRTSSNSISLYKNNTLQITDSTISTVVPDESRSVFLCVRNLDGVAASFGQRYQGMILIGNGEINISSLYTRIQTYMTARGINV